VADIETKTGKQRFPRFLRGYPVRRKPMIRRLTRGTVSSAKYRLPRPRVHARAWKYRTTLDENQAMEQRAYQGIRGSLEERIFYQALLDRGFIPEVDFSFQSSTELGGRAELGGMVADFLFPGPMVVVQVQSYWHTITLEHERRDDDQSLSLQNKGYLVLEIWPNTMHDPNALDWWIERNISHLWGTSSQPLGNSSAPDTAYMEVLFRDIYYPRLLALESAINEIRRVLL
jgi:very-short-patch-repair endonuclease